MKATTRSAKLHRLNNRIARLQIQSIGLMIDELAAKVVRDVRQLGIDGQSFFRKLRREQAQS